MRRLSRRRGVACVFLNKVLNDSYSVYLKDFLIYWRNRGTCQTNLIKRDNH